MWPQDPYPSFRFQSIPYECNGPLIRVVAEVVFAINNGVGKKREDGPIGATFHFEHLEGSIDFTYKDTPFSCFHYYERGSALAFWHLGVDGGEAGSSEIILPIVRKDLEIFKTNNLEKSMEELE